MPPAAPPPMQRQGALPLATLSLTPNRLSMLTNTSWSVASACEAPASTSGPNIAARRNVMSISLCSGRREEPLVGVCSAGVRTDRTMGVPGLLGELDAEVAVPIGSVCDALGIDAGVLAAAVRARATP